MIKFFIQNIWHVTYTEEIVLVYFIPFSIILF